MKSKVFGRVMLLPVYALFACSAAFALTNRYESAGISFIAAIVIVLWVEICGIKEKLLEIRDDNQSK